MKRFATAAALALGMVGAGLLAGCRHSVILTMSSFSGNKGGPDTFVTLVPGSDGICRATDGVGVLGGKKNGKIVWHVTNGCATDQYLTFTHYQEHLSGGTFGPVVTDVVDPDPLYSVKIKAGAADKKVSGRISKDNDGGSADKLYKYWICVGPAEKPMTNCLDPDVDVWPF